MADGGAVETRSRLSAIARNAATWLQAHPLAWSGGLLLVALAFYVAFEAQVIPGLGLWYDELFSLWAGDPAIPFGDAYATRILPDTNAPIYFSLVWLAQSLGLTDRAAFLAINIPIIGGLMALIVARGWRNGLAASAMCAVALLLATAPLLTYGPEGRVYGIVMAVCAVAAFEAGRLVAGARAGPGELVLVAILGVAAAWMHVFGAILVGSLAAAMLVVCAMQRRRDVVVWGVVAGAATSVAFAIWIVFAFPLFTGTTSWIGFDRQWVFNALWELKFAMIGPIVGVFVGAAFVAVSLLARHSRAAALALTITGVLLFAIPLAISFKMPIFLHRYLLIGFPALLVLCVFVIRSHIMATNGVQLRRYGMAALGVAFLAFPILQGAQASRENMATRNDWIGAQPVLAAAEHCPAGEIRTATFRPFDYGFTYFLKGRLASVPADTAPVRDIAQIDCPVLAWAEHLENDIDASMSINDVLLMFKLTNTTGQPLELTRHPRGFVLSRADAARD